MMKIKFLRWSLVLVLVASITGCTSVPLTGRQQLLVMPHAQMMSMSAQNYGQFLNENKLSQDAEATAMVQEVGTNIRVAVEEYMAEIGQAGRLAGFDWQFQLVDSPERNAFVMPGGRAVVYAGILEVAENETGLAVVLGHEVAHAVARHGNERMSQMVLAQAGQIAASEYVRRNVQESQAMWMTAIGLSSQLGMLKYSRTHESEADHMGLIFMAKAGYDPREASDFWVRMASGSKGGAPPEWLSTHPSNRTRAAKLKQLLPAAMPHYEKAIAAKKNAES
jgi:predicted Zn-dependent protease